MRGGLLGVFSTGVRRRLGAVLGCRDGGSGILDGLTAESGVRALTMDSLVGDARFCDPDCDIFCGMVMVGCNNELILAEGYLVH